MLNTKGLNVNNKLNKIEELRFKIKRYSVNVGNINLYPKLLELHKWTSEPLPQVGDIIIGTTESIQRFGIFLGIVEIYNNLYKGRKKATALLHYSNMEKKSPLRNWHRVFQDLEKGDSNYEYYKDLNCLTNEILVEIENINEKGYSLKEINPYAEVNHEDIIKSSEIKQYDFYELIINDNYSYLLDRRLDSEKQSYYDKYYSFRELSIKYYEKSIKSSHKILYDGNYNCIVYNENLFIPSIFLTSKYFVTKDFTKVIILNEGSFNNLEYNSNKVSITYFDVEKKYKILLENKFVLENYNSELHNNYLKDCSAFESHKLELEENIKKEKMILNSNYKVLKMYSHTSIGYKPGKIDSGWKLISKEKSIREFVVYEYENKKYIFDNNKLKDYTERIKYDNNYLDYSYHRNSYQINEIYIDCRINPKEAYKRFYGLQYTDDEQIIC